MQLKLFWVDSMSLDEPHFLMDWPDGLMFIRCGESIFTKWGEYSIQYIKGVTKECVHIQGAFINPVSIPLTDLAPERHGVL